MSIQAVTWVLEDAPDLPAHLVGVLLGLANHADRNGQSAYPGQAALAWYARKTDRAVRNDLDQLLELKLIREGDQRLVDHISADRRPVVYDLAMERKRPRMDLDGRNSASGRGRKQSSPRKTRATGSQVPPATGSPVPAGSGVPAGSPVPNGRKPTSEPAGSPLPTNRPRNRPEPTTRTNSRREHAQDDADGRSAGKPARASDDDTDFATFWATYPRRVAKEQARKTWAALMKRGEDPQLIIVGAARFRDNSRRASSDIKYTPHPSSWLNAGRWTDEPDPPPPPQLRAVSGDYRPSTTDKRFADAMSLAEWARAEDERLGLAGGDQ